MFSIELDNCTNTKLIRGYALVTNLKYFTITDNLARVGDRIFYRDKQGLRQKKLYNVYMISTKRNHGSKMADNNH